MFMTLYLLTDAQVNNELSLQTKVNLSPQEMSQRQICRLEKSRKQTRVAFVSQRKLL